VQDSDGKALFQAAPARACGLCDFEAAGESAAVLAADGSAAAVAADLAAVPDDVPTGPSVTTGDTAAAGVGVEVRAPQAISPANAFVMTDMMTDVVQRGTAQRAAVALKRKDIAGKTGTTSDRRDTWFVGFNADVAAAVWLGFDQERSLGENEEGGKTALPMWIYFMQEALRDKPEHRQPEPPGVVRTWVSRESGAPVRAGAPGALFETFLEQYAPQPGMGSFGDDGVGAEALEPAAADESIF
jgi:penicillin-binding protein 1A